MLGAGDAFTPCRNGAATMADVAELAGVSSATVSRVFHGNNKVAAPTRAKVQAAIEALRYTPHPAAQELASGKARVIGVIVNTIENPVSAAIVQGVESELQENGYRLLLSSSYSCADVEENLIRTYMSLSTAGIIINASWCSGEFFAKLAVNNTPIVHINPERDISASCRFPTIRVDGVLGGKLAAEHLIQLGHKRIGYIGRRVVGELQRARFQGLKQAMTEAGLELDLGLVANVAQGSESGYLGVQRLLAQTNPPSAIFCYYDMAAYGAIEALNEARLKIPDDVSVVGFDDVFMSRYLGLTTVSQPFEDMGKLAAQIILEHARGQMRLADIQVIPKLVIRRSTGPCRGA